MELMAAMEKNMESLDELESENSKLKAELTKKTEEIVELRHGIAEFYNPFDLKRFQSLINTKGINKQKVSNTQVSIAPIRIFLH